MLQDKTQCFSLWRGGAFYWLNSPNHSQMQVWSCTMTTVSLQLTISKIGKNPKILYCISVSYYWSLALMSICCCVTRTYFWLKWNPQQSNTWENCLWEQRWRVVTKTSVLVMMSQQLVSFQYHLNWNRHAQRGTGFKTFFVLQRDYHAEVGPLAGVSLYVRTGPQWNLQDLKDWYSKQLLNLVINVLITCHQERWAIMSPEL